jgi:hypothetical protein
MCSSSSRIEERSGEGRREREREGGREREREGAGEGVREEYQLILFQKRFARR